MQCSLEGGCYCDHDDRFAAVVTADLCRLIIILVNSRAYGTFWLNLVYHNNPVCLDRDVSEQRINRIVL